MSSRGLIASLRRCGRILLSSKARGSAATEVMQAVPGSVAKGGAEGVLCIGLDDGSALALKSEDGSSRGLLPAAARSST